MSEDEDELRDDGSKSGRFLSRPPVYRTEIVSRLGRAVIINDISLPFDIQLTQLLAAIDNKDDPKPSHKYIIRVLGDSSDEPPPLSAKKIEHRARRWMVRADWLTNPENRKYDIPQRVVDNGKLWGDENDPEELLAKAKEISDAKKDIRAGKKIKVEKESTKKSKKSRNSRKKGKGGEAEGSKTQKKGQKGKEKAVGDTSDDLMDSSDPE